MSVNFSDCPSIIRGTWQLSDNHSTTSLINPAQVLLDCMRVGQTRFDTADIYTGAEDVLGEALKLGATENLNGVVHTKFVPDLTTLETITLSQVRNIIRRSLKRLHIDQLELVQFHWWDFTVDRYLDVLSYLFQLKSEGIIKHIGLTNFDSNKLKEVVNAGFDIASIQCQVSLLDHRVEDTLKPLCDHYNIKILSYGTLSGGFLTDRWLGKTEPNLETLSNRSLVKYKLIIDDWGGWDRFQDFMSTLRTISDKYNSNISQIARVAILQSGRSDAVIVGIGRTDWKSQNRELATDQKLTLEASDIDSIFAWKSEIKGEVYALERDRSGRHGAIMKYNLNKA